MGFPRIVSGGQTGADRAALEWARRRGLGLGGWCPAGGRSEDGSFDPDDFGMRETPRRDYRQRTEWNVRDSDGTVIISIGEQLTGGSLLTRLFAKRHGKPHLHLHAGIEDEASRMLSDFIVANGIRVLNVAGPRASNEPRVGQLVESILDDAHLLLEQD